MKHGVQFWGASGQAVATSIIAGDF